MSDVINLKQVIATLLPENCLPVIYMKNEPQYLQLLFSFMEKSGYNCTISHLYSIRNNGLKS